MSVHTILERIYAQFHYYASQLRVTLFHPDSRYRSPFIAYLLENAQFPIFYYGLSRDDIDLETFVRALSHRIALSEPLFGEHVNALAESDWLKTDAVVNAFLADLRQIERERYALILDDYDRSDSSDRVQRFLEKLIAALPAQCHLILNSRTLPRLPWTALIAQRSAVILRDDQLVKTDFYGTPQRSGAPLEVNALGPGFVVFKDRLIDNWEGHLPRLLFFFALDRPMITRSEICQAFWEELDSDQAVNVFHVTKRRLHKALNTDVLVHENGFYRINPKLDLHYDTSVFVTLLLEGREPGNPNRIDAYQRAVDLYRGHFLQGHQDPWIVERRASYLTGYLEALNAIADHWTERERPEMALSVYQRAAALTEPLNEEVHRKILRLYLKMGRRSEAAAHLQRVIEIAARAGRELEPETIRLGDEIHARA
jgi:DNA-binding SARP family transcriptional activator